MRLNESLKRAIYSDIMNDVARIVKQRVNEEVLPTGIDLDVELDKFEEENSFEFKLYISDDKNNQCNKTIKGTSDIKINALLFWTFLKSTKLYEKKIKNVQTKVTIDNLLYNKVYSHVFRDQESYNTIANKLINNAINYAKYNDRSGKTYNKTILFFKVLYNFCINYKFTKKFADDYSYKDFFKSSMNKEFHDYAPNDIYIKNDLIGLKITIGDDSNKYPYLICGKSLGDIFIKFDSILKASIENFGDVFFKIEMSNDIMSLFKKIRKHLSDDDELVELLYDKCFATAKTTKELIVNLKKYNF